MDAMKSAEASLKDAEHFTKNPDAKFERPEAGEAAKDYSKLRKIPEAFSELIETVILREKQLCAELASLRANSVSGEAVDAVIEAAKRMNEWEWSAVLAESAMHSDDKAEIQQASIELSAALAKLSAGNTQEKK
jgi:predicted transcriptional regulator